MTPPPAAAHPIRIGVSSCLLGEAVRYDGGHKRDHFLTDLLGRYVEWVPVCPELESGLGVRRPSLPVEEEGRLQDPELRENFIERVFAYQRLRELFRGRWSVGRLVAFHTAHKLQLMAHSQPAYAELGRLVAAAKQQARAVLRRRYTDAFMAALARIATRSRNASVLQHVAGHLKQHLDSAARGELAELIHDYRRGLVP